MAQYQVTEWNAGDPITQEKMRKIENGIAQAWLDAETAQTKATSAQSAASTNANQISSLSNAIDSIRIEMANDDDLIAQGQNAWRQVLPTITMNGNNVTRTLLDRFTTDEGKISNLETEVHTARGNHDALVNRLDAIDGITSFSTAPLLLASFFGILFCFLALIAIIFVIVRTLIYGDPVGGWPSLVCIILLVSGVQLLCIGIIGRYLSKVYLETKKRPLYIVRETNQK